MNSNPKQIVEELPGFGPVDEVQYAGYINVEPRTDSNLFYWMFERIHSNVAIDQSPLIVWLQGGPGSSSMYGLFTEVGPYTCDADMKLSRNEFSWHKHAHLMFLDYPVGTGFSYTNDESRYVRDDTQGADDFLTFLNGFYTLHPEYRSCPLFLTGESYAGKYIPAIGGRILCWNDECPVDEVINLHGVAICGAWTHPTAQIPSYTAHAFSHGLIDESDKVKVDETMSKVMELIVEGRMLDSTNLWDEAADYIYKQAGHFSPYDVRDYSGTEDDPQHYNFYLVQADVRRALNVGDRIYNEDDGVNVFEALRGNDMVSSLEYLPEILLKTRVLLFNGQFDWICNHEGVEEMLENDLVWDGRIEFLEARKQEWTVNGNLAGYVRSAGSLTHVLVLGAGHMAPADQPLHSFQLIGAFINNELIIESAPAA